jgi:hypothetical protein
MSPSFSRERAFVEPNGTADVFSADEQRRSAGAVSAEERWASPCCPMVA